MTIRRPADPGLVSARTHWPPSPASAAVLRSNSIGARPRAVCRLSVAVRSTSTRFTQLRRRGMQLELGRGRVHDDALGPGTITALPAASLARIRHAWTPSASAGVAVSECEPAPVARPASIQAPDTDPSPAAFTSAWLRPAPLRLSATLHASATAPGAPGDDAESPDTVGAVRSRWMVPAADPPPVPSPSALTSTPCTPSPIPSSARVTSWLPTPGAPVQRAWPAIRTRCAATPSPPKLSLVVHCTRTAPARALIQPGVRARRLTAGGVRSRTRIRGLSMK